MFSGSSTNPCARQSSVIWVRSPYKESRRVLLMFDGLGVENNDEEFTAGALEGP